MFKTFVSLLYGQASYHCDASQCLTVNNFCTIRDRVSRLEGWKTTGAGLIKLRGSRAGTSTVKLVKSIQLK